MRNQTALGLGILLLATTTTITRADDGAVRRCRALIEPAARLACYDAMPLVHAAAASAPSPAPSPATLPALSPVPVAAPAAAAALSAQSAGAESAANFGLSRQTGQTDSIGSRIPGLFEGWKPRDRIRLANGQVWQVTDDSRGVYRLPSPAVTVRRTFFGSFELDIEGVNQLLRVRRVE